MNKVIYVGTPVADDWTPCICSHPRWVHDVSSSGGFVDFTKCRDCPCQTFSQLADEVGLAPEAQTHRDA